MPIANPIPPGVDPNAILEVPTWAILLAGYAGAHLVGFLFRIINQLLSNRYGFTPSRRVNGGSPVTRETCAECNRKWEGQLTDLKSRIGRMDKRHDELVKLLLEEKMGKGE